MASGFRQFRYFGDVQSSPDKVTYGWTATDGYQVIVDGTYREVSYKWSETDKVVQRKAGNNPAQTVGIEQGNYNTIYDPNNKNATIDALTLPLLRMFINECRVRLSQTQTDYEVSILTNSGDSNSLQGTVDHYQTYLSDLITLANRIFTANAKYSNISKDVLLSNVCDLINNREVVHLGIQSIPGCIVYLNGSNNKIYINNTGVFELDLSTVGQTITAIRFDSDWLETAFDLNHLSDDDNPSFENPYIIIDLVYDISNLTSAELQAEEEDVLE